MDNEDQIKNNLDIVAKKCKIKNWRYEKKLFNRGKINFMGIITPVTLINEDTGETLDIVIKTAPRIEYLEVIFSDYYIREVCFYTALRPIMANKVKMNLENLIPQCYYADSSIENRVLVLKDIASLGFRRYEDGMYLDEDHLMVTLRALAKFHSISMILNQNNIKIPNVDMLRPFNEDYPTFYCKAIRFVMKKYLFLVDGMQCEKFMNNLYLYITSMDFFDHTVKAAKRLVYGHGDMWKENLLFKYTATQPEKPEQVCLVDYQQTRIMSPAWDVLFLIMSCTESSVRRQHYKSFVTTYYETLQQTLLSNGLDIEKLYPEEDFNSDMKLVFPSVVSLTFMSYLMWLGLENPENMLAENEDYFPVQENWDTFKQIVENIFLDFKGFGFLDDKDQNMATQCG